MASTWHRALGALPVAALLIGAHGGMALPAAARMDQDYLSEGEEARPAIPPRILSQSEAKRLRRINGISLQWIGWGKQRGKAATTVDPAGVWRVFGEQRGEQDQAVVVDGTITEIGANYFIMQGAVTIANAPDQGRTCEGYGEWRFAITQNRKYYRLREFEWCDQLTDYVDLYF